MIHCLSVKEIWHWPGIGIGKQNLAEDRPQASCSKTFFVQDKTQLQLKKLQIQIGKQYSANELITCPL